MKCANPILVLKINGKKRYRHWDLSTRFEKAFHDEVFNCNKCLFCRKNNSLELARRCVLHASLYADNCFITLTYDENSVSDNKLNYKDIQDFKKRYRQHVKRKYNKKIEIFNVHEYGKNGRKHWHLVVFNHDFKDKELYTVKNGNKIYQSQELKKLWSHGYNTIGEVTEASAMYQAQYTMKDIKNGNTNNDKKAKSNHSGIGKPFFMKYYKEILTLGYIQFGQIKMKIPRYFEKIAHKHFSHFYEKQNFFATDTRKEGIYRPFKLGEENEEIANLYIEYKKIKDRTIESLEEQWKIELDKYFINQEKPDFIKAAENALYDLKNKEQTSKEEF